VSIPELAEEPEEEEEEDLPFSAACALFSSSS
jgi:hypothetical protein